MVRYSTIGARLNVLVLVVLCLAVVGCGSSVIDGSSDSTGGGSGSFKVAMLLPGPVDDQGWSQAGYEGLRLVEKELGADVAFTASVPEDDLEKQKLFRQYADAGFDLIIGHGGNYITAIERVAEEFPRTKFALTTGHGGNNKNLGAVIFDSLEIGYLAGTVAALKTKTNKIAFIGGVPYPDLLEEAAGIERGARATNPEIEVSIEWVDSWADPARAREITQAQLKAGADVILTDNDKGNMAVIREVESAGAYAIGWGSAEHALAPNTILTTVIQRVPVLVLESAILVRQGRWEGKKYILGLREKAYDLAPFYGLLTPAEEAAVMAARNDILAGKIAASP